MKSSDGAGEKMSLGLGMCGWRQLEEKRGMEIYLIRELQYKGEIKSKIQVWWNSL